MKRKREREEKKRDRKRERMRNRRTERKVMKMREDSKERDERDTTLTCRGNIF